VLSTLTLTGAAASFLGFPVITYLPVFAGDVLGTGAGGYSLLLSSFGIGAIAGALVTAQRGHAPGRGRTLLLALGGYGVSTLGAVLSRSQWLSMALLLLAGFCLVSAFSTLNSLVQENAPDSLRGRIMSIYGLAFRGGNPVGSLVAGVLVGPLGAPAVIGGAATLMILGAVTLYWASPRLRGL